MADDPDRRFDAVLAALDPAMVVVTAAAAEERDGCLVGFHGQVGIDPRRYIVWLSALNRTYRIALAASHLAVHVLAADDQAMARRFGGVTGDEVDKLAGLAWSSGPGGVPLVAALPARFVGRVVRLVEVPNGDHVGFVLAPVEVDGHPPALPLRLADTADIQAGHPVDGP